MNQKQVGENFETRERFSEEPALQATGLSLVLVP